MEAPKFPPLPLYAGKVIPLAQLLRTGKTDAEVPQQIDRQERYNSLAIPTQAELDAMREVHEEAIEEHIARGFGRPAVQGQVEQAA